ncbi:MAG TPA: chemotaxis protein CheA [Sedimenticola thiotaurini]|uniref:Chemotaxis protein CheA n=1 Tax=Sedimenticola thiotaurini TaxID=1543721 RepID=A0A831RNS5_9GAMM|nr:chemotaxis protein CheA [Sedimenticola thiotaurini]
MAIDMNDEILQDFLVEAGEILELLNEQLIDLEQRPDDFDLLNAVFRGFHTIKGGAGFLSIDALVEVCHRAEDVFNVLRQGQRQVDARLMDVVLQVLDVVNDMFAMITNGEEPEPAEPELLESLSQLSVPDGEAEPEPEPEPEPAAEPEVAETTAAEPEAATGEGPDEITEDEFEALLDELHGKGRHGGVPATAASASSTGSDEITEEEFEALLDELHGKGRHGGVPAQAGNRGGEERGGSAPETRAATPDEITEEEFEALLDELHGKGRHGGVPSAAAKAADGGDGPAPKPAAAAEPAQQKVKDAEKVTGETAPAAAPKKPAGPTPKKPSRPTAKKAMEQVKSTETTVRVDTARLDEIMNMVGELVLVRNRLATLKTKLGDDDVANAVANLDVVTADLQNSVMKTRMQPVKKVFGRFPRVVRDLARSLKKEIDLELHGEETDLDKNLVEALADPLVHLVRNAVDHGIESPEEREQAGKPRRGKVVLSAAQEGDHILLSIADDGRGMDPDVLRRKAVEKGMMDQEAADRLEDRECYNLIFHPGFSTKTEISDVSGRGVGMDVVKTRIAQLNGSVEIDSAYGQGSVIRVKLPLTLAILPTLMVVLGEQPFALPLSSVVEIFNLDLKRTNVVDGQLTIMVRERALPLFYLHKWLVNGGTGAVDSEVGHVVVVNVGGKHVGLVVDYLIGQEEVVIKPLGSMLQGLDGMAGATITGDGKIALILDVPGLMRKYARRH